MSVSCLRSVCKRKCNAPVGPMQDVQETFVFHEKTVTNKWTMSNSHTFEFTVKSVFDLKKQMLCIEI